MICVSWTGQWSNCNEPTVYICVSEIMHRADFRISKKCSSLWSYGETICYIWAYFEAKQKSFYKNGITILDQLRSDCVDFDGIMNQPFKGQYKTLYVSSFKCYKSLVNFGSLEYNS